MFGSQGETPQISIFIFAIFGGLLASLATYGEDNPRRPDAIVEYGLVGNHRLMFCGDVAAGIGIAIEPREVAAGDLKPDAMSRFEDITCAQQIDGIFVFLIGLQ